MELLLQEIPPALSVAKLQISTLLNQVEKSRNDILAKKNNEELHCEFPIMVKQFFLQHYLVHGPVDLV